MDKVICRGRLALVNKINTYILCMYLLTHAFFFISYQQIFLDKLIFSTSASVTDKYTYFIKLMSTFLIYILRSSPKKLDWP